MPQDPDKKPDTVEPPPSANPEHDGLMDDLFGDLEDEEGGNPAANAALIGQNAALLAQVQALQADVVKLERKNRDAADLLRRTESRVAEDRDFAAQKFVKELLPVVDNLERALSAFPPEDRARDPGCGRLAAGVEMTLKGLAQVFNKFGVRAEDPLGQEFDETRHEVITTRADDAAEPGTVLAVVEKGYVMKDRVIRPAKVIISPQ